MLLLSPTAPHHGLPLRRPRPIGFLTPFGHVSRRTCDDSGEHGRPTGDQACPAVFDSAGLPIGLQLITGVLEETAPAAGGPPLRAGLRVVDCDSRPRGGTGWAEEIRMIWLPSLIC